MRMCVLQFMCAEQSLKTHGHVQHDREDVIHDLGVQKLVPESLRDPLTEEISEQGELSEQVELWVFDMGVAGEVPQGLRIGVKSIPEERAEELVFGISTAAAAIISATAASFGKEWLYCRVQSVSLSVMVVCLSAVALLVCCVR